MAQHPIPWLIVLLIAVTIGILAVRRHDNGR